MMEAFDAVLGGLIACWHDRSDLILLTSDHGNMEDMDVRGHTLNPVPGLLIGPAELRARLAPQMSDLTDVAPAVMTALYGPDWRQSESDGGP
jgi:bisphosphoglycerate-independent phosphoglycerate mutase (AlkP superfamily)